MRRGNAHVNASRKTFRNVYARFHNFHRKLASQERAVFFNAALLVVKRHRGCVRSTCGPPGRWKIRQKQRRAARPTENSPCPPASRFSSSVFPNGKATKQSNLVTYVASQLTRKSAQVTLLPRRASRMPRQAAARKQTALQINELADFGKSSKGFRLKITRI